MSLQDKLKKRMAGEEPEESGMNVMLLDPVKVSIGELKELLPGCQCPEHKRALECCIRKNGNKDHVVVTMDKADLLCVMEGGEVVEELVEDGVVKKVHMKVSKSSPPPPAPPKK